MLLPLLLLFLCYRHSWILLTPSTLLSLCYRPSWILLIPNTAAWRCRIHTNRILHPHAHLNKFLNHVHTFLFLILIPIRYNPIRIIYGCRCHTKLFIPPILHLILCSSDMHQCIMPTLLFSLVDEENIRGIYIYTIPN